MKVDNRDGYSSQWAWNARQGYPGQFRRDRMAEVDRSNVHVGDNGYSGWTQTENGAIVIVDYTWGSPEANKPFIRSYVVEEAHLVP